MGGRIRCSKLDIAIADKWHHRNQNFVFTSITKSWVCFQIMQMSTCQHFLNPQNWGSLKTPGFKYYQTVADGAMQWSHRHCELIVSENASIFSVDSHYSLPAINIYEHMCGPSPTICQLLLFLLKAVSINIVYNHITISKPTAFCLQYYLSTM